MQCLIFKFWSLHVRFLYIDVGHFLTLDVYESVLCAYAESAQFDFVLSITIVAFAHFSMLGLI